MKNFTSTLFILLVPLLVFAQEDVVKVNLSSALLKTIYLSYEHKFSEKVTVNMGGSIMPNRNIPFGDQLIDKESNIDAMRYMKISGWSFTPEVRIYTNGGQALRGLYVAPYFRISQYFLELSNYSYNNTILESSQGRGKIQFNGEVSSMGGGIMLGYQYNLYKSIYLDIWIIGLGIHRTFFSMEANSKDLPSDHFETGSDLSKHVSSYFKPLNANINQEFGTDYTRSSALRIIPGIRGLGINIGIAF